CDLADRLRSDDLRPEGALQRRRRRPRRNHLFRQAVPTAAVRTAPEPLDRFITALLADEARLRFWHDWPRTCKERSFGGPQSNVLQRVSRGDQGRKGFAYANCV